MKVLVTGGAGFIGSHLVEVLVARGDQVFVIDNLATGNKNNLDKVINKIEFLQSSIVSSESYGFIHVRKPDVIVHAAASYKDPDNWEGDSKTNVLGAVNIVKSALSCGVKRLIYFQTSLCYGPPQETPITLDHPINPICSYAISKTAAEQYIRISGLDYVSFRLANFFGPRQVSGPVPTFYKKLSSGEQCIVVPARRDYVYVDNLIPIVVKAIDGQGSGIYQVSSGTDDFIIDLYKEIREAIGFVSDFDPIIPEQIPQPVIKPLGKDDVPSILLDNSKVVEELGFDIEVSRKEGIRQTVDWFSKYGVGETFTHLKLATPDDSVGKGISYANK